MQSRRNAVEDVQETEEEGDKESHSHWTRSFHDSSPRPLIASTPLLFEVQVAGEKTGAAAEVVVVRLGMVSN